MNTNPTPSKSEAEAIAGRLTEAQRRALVFHGLGPFSTSICSLTSAACRVALQRKGIVVDRMYATALTPLGLSVRQILTGDHS